MKYTFSFSYIEENLPVLFDGFLMTVHVSLISILIASAIGIAGAAVRLLKVPVLFIYSGWLRPFRSLHAASAADLFHLLRIGVARLADIVVLGRSTRLVPSGVVRTTSRMSVVASCQSPKACMKLQIRSLSRHSTISGWWLFRSVCV